MLANRLKNLRKENKKTQEQIADLLSVSQAAYSKYECDLSEPDSRTLTKLSEFYNVTVDYLLGHSDNPLPNSQLPDTEYHLNLFNQALKAKGLPSVEHIFDTTKEALIGKNPNIPPELQNTQIAFNGDLEKDLTAKELAEMKKFREFLLSQRKEQ